MKKSISKRNKKTKTSRRTRKTRKSSLKGGAVRSGSVVQGNKHGVKLHKGGMPTGATETPVNNNVNPNFFNPLNNNLNNGASGASGTSRSISPTSNTSSKKCQQNFDEVELNRFSEELDMFFSTLDEETKKTKIMSKFREIFNFTNLQSLPPNVEIPLAKLPTILYLVKTTIDNTLMKPDGEPDKAKSIRNFKNMLLLKKYCYSQQLCIGILTSFTYFDTNHIKDIIKIRSKLTNVSIYGVEKYNLFEKSIHIVDIIKYLSEHSGDNPLYTYENLINACYHLLDLGLNQCPFIIRIFNYSSDFKEYIENEEKRIELQQLANTLENGMQYQTQVLDHILRKKYRPNLRMRQSDPMLPNY